MAPPKKKKVAPIGEASSPKKAGGKKGKKKVVPAPPAVVAAVTPLEKARSIWQKEEPSDQRVVVVYAAYTTAFECREGIVRWKDIDDEYCLSFVFKGDFGRRIKACPKGSEESAEIQVVSGDPGVDDEGVRDASRDEMYFLGLDPNFDGKYVLEIEESELGLNVETRRGPIVFERDPNETGFPIGGQRKEGCSCIYGNPCADQYVCLNWANRFDIATKNGWKGF